MSGPRHSIRDFAMDADFATRHVLARAGAQHSVIWSDVNLGSGIVCLFGPYQGLPVFEIYRTNCNPIARSSGGEAEIQGNVAIEPLKRIQAGPAIAEKLVEPSIAEDMAFLDLSMPLYTRCWSAMGSTWPVALLQKGDGPGAHWTFVQVAKAYPDRRRVIVDVVFNKDSIAKSRGKPLAMHAG